MTHLPGMRTATATTAAGWLAVEGSATEVPRATSDRQLNRLRAHARSAAGELGTLRECAPTTERQLAADGGCADRSGPGPRERTPITPAAVPGGRAAARGVRHRRTNRPHPLTRGGAHGRHRRQAGRGPGAAPV